MLVEIQGIRKHFRKKSVLEDISLSAQPGACIAILGENGCGKSTFLSILAGVLRPDAGSFLWEGEDLLHNASRRRDLVGYVPQGTPLLQELTALDNLKLWYEGSGKDLNRDLREGVPAMMGVEEFLRVPVRKLSGGMKKRLSISCAVARRPRILLMDEPSAALDVVCRERISSYILDFQRQGGILLLATHDVQEMALCSTWYLMKQGVLHPYAYDGNVHRLVGAIGNPDWDGDAGEPMTRDGGRE